MPSNTLVKAGLVTLALALLLPWSFAYWLKTRTFEPVDKPVLLEAGKIQREDFELNLREDYHIRLEADYSADDWTEGKCSFRSWEDTDWKVYRLSEGAIKIGELWASSAEILESGGIPDGFAGKPGKYELEWSGPAASACLNARHPRVHVYASSSEYTQIGEFILSETISVYVDARKGFLVNGHPVKREELEAKLKEELSRQMVWTVYLEADSDCLFMDLAQAIDTIQGLGAKVIWITPKMREEWKQKNAL